MKNSYRPYFVSFHIINVGRIVTDIVFKYLTVLVLIKFVCGIIALHAFLTSHATQMEGIRFTESYYSTFRWIEFISLL